MYFLLHFDGDESLHCNIYVVHILSKASFTRGSLLVVLIGLGRILVHVMKAQKTKSDYMISAKCIFYRLQKKDADIISSV